MMKPRLTFILFAHVNESSEIILFFLFHRSFSFPYRAGNLFDIDFIKKMQLAAKTLKLSNRLVSLLVTLVTEAVCASNSSLNVSVERGEETIPDSDVPVSKRMKVDDFGRGTEYDMPPFYYFVYHLRLKNVEIPKYVDPMSIFQSIKLKTFE